MANPLKQLAGQTAIYGLSSIVGRLLNYFLVPLHTLVFVTNQFGIITEMYSYVAFLVVLLTYGMETTFFRFSTQEGQNKQKVYSTVLTSLFITTALFIGLASAFSIPIAEWLKYPNNNEFVIWFSIIVGLDAISSIPLARLRQEGKAALFALANLGNVGVNIGLNLFFLAYCLPKYAAGESNWLIEACYNPDLGVSYVFISNLAASTVKFLLLVPWMVKPPFSFDVPLLKKMLLYGSPLLLAGLAGIINETIDRVMLKRMLFDDLGEKETMSLVGIYGACYKLSIIINLFVQAFRYAAEPFFFAQEKEKNAKEVYATVMNWFVIVCSTIFLAVMVNLKLISYYFIPNPAYWVGLKVVPILLLANVCLGIYYNQSVWYKLTSKTGYGALLAVFGAIITLVLNFWWIPQYNYMGSAWATLACYASMMIASYFLGQYFFPINYNLKKIALYTGSAFGLWLVNGIIVVDSLIIQHIINNLFWLVFITFVLAIEKPKFLWKLM